MSSIPAPKTQEKFDIVEYLGEVAADYTEAKRAKLMAEALLELRSHQLAALKEYVEKLEALERVE